MKVKGSFYIPRTHVGNYPETQEAISRLLEISKHHPGGCMYQSLRVEGEPLIKELRSGVISDGFFSRLAEFFHILREFI